MGSADWHFEPSASWDKSSNPITQVTIERHWTRLIFNGGNTDAPGDSVGFNPVVDAEYTTLNTTPTARRSRCRPRHSNTISTATLPR